MISMRISNTPIKVKVTIFFFLVPLWVAITWLGIVLHPGRGFWTGVLVGFTTVLVLLIADFGHAIAHIISARYSGAPMDEIQISAEQGMPRTLYWNNEVSPNVHRIRALGGPVFNLLGLLLSLLIYTVVPRNSISWELAAWSAGGHGLLFIMSLTPMPMVDGGTLLKWTLVARGKAVREADQIVKRIDWSLGIAAGIVGLVLIVMQIWIAGMILMGVGAVVIAITAGKLR
ncbi:MAG: hypothetical protein CVU46_05130 [Chloroflexi bacterium HGW-Chloroflexi-8]|nr:MAG: hypothetical protein CVU46_05130 [Chloroflexi bacterium HGW-Chloroflexi-8]